MATFGLASFSAKNYASFRPTYPAALYERLFAFHGRGAGSALAIDIGCGAGQATRPLAQHFEHVIGTDPGKGMIEAARESASERNIEYRVAKAEDHSFLADNSVDLVASGQAVHWFEHSKWFTEMARILKPGGTLAYWGYSFPQLVNQPKSSQILVHYATDRNWLGPFWPKGREILDNKYRDIQIPGELFEDVHRDEGIGMTANGNIGSTESYLRTWSCVHNYLLEHPNDKSKRQGGHGDVVDKIIDEIKAVEGFDDGSKVQLEWPLHLLMMRKVVK